ncbi:MAG: DegT/DnrJ/EryC1/StrS family aminotransferase [Bacteroidetes bacterium]|nr:DegT/DnrJ/EryC1/StrS family aminotransferase [Bacteroidota bacterium]
MITEAFPVKERTIPFSPPFVDEDVIAEVLSTLNSGWITTGPKVQQLEEEVILLTGCQAAICTNSWTSAAQLVLKWFGIGPGDEVILPAYTYSATALAIIHSGATPVMVDVNEDFSINIEQIQSAITSKTKAIIPVDFAGWPCDYRSINELLDNQKNKALFSPSNERQRKLGRILCISDAAHSIGSTYFGKPSVLSSDISIFSFHAVKNVTTAEGGCVCLNLPGNFDVQKEYTYLKLCTLNGQTKSAFEKLNGNWKYDIAFAGLKINMPDICAAIGLAQIRKYSSQILIRRKQIAQQYQAAFQNFKWFKSPHLLTEERESSYHLFPLRIDQCAEKQRDSIIQELFSKGISVNVHFIPLPMLTLFRDIGFDIKDFPNAYRHYQCEISLPIYPQLQNTEVSFIIQSVISAVEKSFQDLAINYLHTL